METGEEPPDVAHAIAQELQEIRSLKRTSVETYVRGEKKSVRQTLKVETYVRKKPKIFTSNIES
jgi:hypothetical protein